jgi:hypothetical protein
MPSLHPWGRVLSRGAGGRALLVGGVVWLPVAAEFAGRSRSQGEATWWRKDLDAGEDRHRIVDEKARTTSRRGLACTHSDPGACLGSRRTPRHVRLRLTRFSGRSQIAFEREGSVRRFLGKRRSRGPAPKGVSCGARTPADLPLQHACRPLLVSWLSAASQSRRFPPLWCFWPGCTGHSASRPCAASSAAPGCWMHRLNLAPHETRAEVAMTSPDRAQHESASPVASYGTESDGEVRACP